METNQVAKEEFGEISSSNAVSFKLKANSAPIGLVGERFASERISPLAIRKWALSKHDFRQHLRCDNRRPIFPRAGDSRLLERHRGCPAAIPK